MKARRPRPCAEHVSEASTQRLSLLLRSLRVLQAQGVRTVSSAELAERFGMHAAQIRKDLAHLGEFGVRGLGYHVADLRARLSSILGLDRTHTVVIVGAGRLGLALADSWALNGGSFRVAALFDVDDARVGERSRTGVPILAASSLAESVSRLAAEIGVLAVPPEAAAEAARELDRGGVRGILNFAPQAVGELPHARVKDVDMALCLETLAIRLPLDA